MRAFSVDELFSNAIALGIGVGKDARFARKWERVAAKISSQK